MKDLEGRVAVITGGASGLGRAMADRFAAERMKLVLADVEGEMLARAEAELKQNGAAVLTMPTDVSKAAEVEALAERAFSHFGAVHVLCNNAGVALTGMLWESSLTDWEWVLGVNLWGVIHGIRAFVPRLIAQDSEGHIVNTSSMAGVLSQPGMGIYNVSKHGVVTLSETLHHELKQRGTKLRVSVLCPGFVATRIMTSERNRPADLRNAAAPPPRPREEEAAREATLRALETSGLKPARVAEMVLDAIRSEKFYIFTHPHRREMVRTRMEEILGEREPTVTPLIA